MYFYNKKNRHIFIKIFLVINEKLLPSFALFGMLIKTSYRKTIKEICSRKIDSFTPDPIIFSYVNVNMNKRPKALPN